MDLVNYSARAQIFLYFRPSFSTWIICSFLFLFIDSAVKLNKKLCYCSLTCNKEWREILWPVKWSTFLEEWLFWQSHLQWILLRYDNIATRWYFLGIFTLMNLIWDDSMNRITGNVLTTDIGILKEYIATKNLKWQILG